MANMNLKYYQNDDKYTDGDIEDVIFKMVQSNIKISDLKPKEVSYPILYHLSEVRENILNWYPFKKTETALEVGAGCGAITGLLCRKMKKITSVELSKRRATINYLRHKEYDNLEILVGNLNDMTLEDKFDYIILNGVFEYAISFTQGDTPYETFLQAMSRFLKKDGRIIIAIENRLGLKYFSGAAEDHTELYFLGLNNYENYNLVRTFSKTEIEEVLKRVGFAHQEFYYPYPDYKFPNEIFTETAFKKNEYGKTYNNYSTTKISLFDEHKVAVSLVKEGVMSTFSNSFLVVAGKQNLSDSQKVIYTKVNNDRVNKFRIMTAIEQSGNERYVIKSPLSKEAAGHIQAIYDNSITKYNGICSNLPGKIGERGVLFPYIESANLNEEIVGYIKDKDIRKIKDVILEIQDGFLTEKHLSNAFQTQEFHTVFGPQTIDRALECMKKANIDLICDNIYRRGDKLLAIDCEWVFSFEVPVQFIIWRTINELYEKYNSLEVLMPRKEMNGEFGIDEEMAITFWYWAVYFAEQYVKSNGLQKYKKEVKHMNLNEIVAREAGNAKINASLYLDNGSGYSEENKIIREIGLEDDNFIVRYDLSGYGNIQKVRFDPLEGECCVCSLQQTVTDFIPLNSRSITDHEELFLTTDPMYEMNFDGRDIKELVIQGKLHKLSTLEITNYIEILLQSCG